MNTSTQQQIESLVTRLIDGQLITTDDGIKEVESLLSQLRSGVNNGLDSCSSGGGVKHSGSRPPVALNALSILNEIEKDAAYLLPGNFPSLETRILSLLIRVDEVGEARALKWLKSVTGKIEHLFAPRRLVEITRPCCECGKTYTHRVTDDGEIQRAFTLQAWVGTDGEAYAQCLSCFTTWEGFEEVARLSRTLTFQSA